MKPAFLEKFTLEKILIYILIAAALITFGFVIYLVVSHFTKSVQITSPLGGENWEIKRTHAITWKASGIDKVGIVLFKGKEPQWIVKDIYAKVGKYQWEIKPGQTYGNDYWIAVFEYPWRNGNKIAYSKGPFAVTYPENDNCDTLTTQNEWPYVASDMPNLRRVFITPEGFTGNLEGLDGADAKCQAEADQLSLGGKWMAFLGGDAEQDLAVERLRRAAKGLDGVFVEVKPATPETTLLRGALCYRLLGKNFDEFLKKLSNLAVVNTGKFGADSFNNFANIWLGRATQAGSKNCVTITSVFQNPYVNIAEKYSYTATCQNWTSNRKLAEGYPVPYRATKPNFPVCYTTLGKSADAVAIGGLASGFTGGAINVNAFTMFQGKYCDTQQKLLCVEK